MGVSDPAGRRTATRQQRRWAEAGKREPRVPSPASPLPLRTPGLLPAPPRRPLSQARTQSTDVVAEIPPSLRVAGIKDGIRGQASARICEDAGDRAHVPRQHRLPEGQGRS